MLRPAALVAAHSRAPASRPLRSNAADIYMRENAQSLIVGSRVRLAPYLRAHIDRYHAWMQDEELLRLTCSEPLSLEEETANQRSWRDDENKVTFIVCALDSVTAEDDLTAGMCGDVNAFLSAAEENEDDDDAAKIIAREEEPLFAEIEIMIAEPSRRRGGLAREALLLFMHWLLCHVPRITKLVVKITDDNLPSRALFASLGFTVHKHMAVFEQTELRLPADEARAMCERHWVERQAQVRTLSRAQAEMSDGGQDELNLSFIDSHFTTKVEYDAWLTRRRKRHKMTLTL